jgi:hypothetical protein
LTDTGFLVFPDSGLNRFFGQWFSWIIGFGLMLDQSTSIAKIPPNPKQDN